jgi:hypothetical protein
MLVGYDDVLQHEVARYEVPESLRVHDVVYFEVIHSPCNNAEILDESDIALVEQQAGCSREQAIAGIIKNNGDIVNAIVAITFNDPEINDFSVGLCRDKKHICFTWHILLGNITWTESTREVTIPVDTQTSQHGDNFGLLWDKHKNSVTLVKNGRIISSHSMPVIGDLHPYYKHMSAYSSIEINLGNNLIYQPFLMDLLHGKFKLRLHGCNRFSDVLITTCG